MKRLGSNASQGRARGAASANARRGVERRAGGGGLGRTVWDRHGGRLPPVRVSDLYFGRTLLITVD